MRMYVNERPVAVEGCADADALCSWPDFKRRFAAIADTCSLDFCKNAAAEWASSSARALAAVAAVAAVLTNALR